MTPTMTDLLLLCLIPLVLYHRPADSLTDDGLSLLALKYAADAHSDDPFASWNASDANPCSWLGVTCYSVSDTRVVDVSLAGRGFAGYIPSELASLASLGRLDLSGNRLSGAVPVQLFHARSLRSLVLRSNNLSGDLPAQICGIAHLVELDLSQNLLTGEVPGGVGSCSDLQKLDLAGNRISGSVPSGVWSTLGSLVEIDLSGNELEGSLPNDLGELRSLSRTFNFSFNRLSGELPQSLGNLPQTVKFDLRNNIFAGEIPSNGAFSRQSASAFAGNPGLCGSILNKPCINVSVSAVPAGHMGGPAANAEVARKRGLKYSSILVICIADAIGVAIVGISIFFLYVKWRSLNHRRGGGNRSSFCDGVPTNPIAEAESPEKIGDDDMEAAAGGGDGLVFLEKGFKFELEELLQASAYALGRTGPRGIVYKVVLGNGVPVTVRRLGSGGADKCEEFAAAAREICRVRHSNLVKLRAFYWATDEKLVISDYIPNGTVAAALHGHGGQKPFPVLPLPARLNIAKGVARGLAHIHEHGQRGYVHGDVKPANILLGDEHEPFLAGFGLTRLMTIVDAGTTRRITGYTAPEARLAWSESTQRSDVYSFGVVVIELLTKKAVEASASSSSTSVGCSMNVEPELAKWVRKMLSEGKKVADPALQLEGAAAGAVDGLLRVGLACTETDPELRPTMKSVSESLEKIGC